MKRHENQPGRTRICLPRNYAAPCPNPKFSIEEVRSFYAAEFPELTNAAITGPETVGERLRYSFERAIGSKG